MARELRIENATVVSPERPEPMRNVTVSIRDGRILSISHRPLPSPAKDAEVIDGHGLYLVPGLIDSHVHTNQAHGMTPQHEAAHPDIARAAREQDPRSYLYFGFTTLIDLISVPEAIERWNAQPEHPDLYFCGATPIVDGYPMVWAPKPERYSQFPYLIVQRGEEATAPDGIDPLAHTPAAVVQRMKDDGASCVKTFYERGDAGQWPVPRLDTIRDLVLAAHKAHLPVLIHASSTEAQEFAVHAGVDIIAHGLWSWSDEPGATKLTPRVTNALNRIMKAKVGWQPTMQVTYGFRDLFDPDYLSDPQLARVLPPALIAWYGTPEGQWFHDTVASSLPGDVLQSGDAAARWQSVQEFYAGTLLRLTNVTRYMAEHKARLLFGTDTPSSPLYTNPPGLNGWREMTRLIEAGVTPAQVFRAATLANAQALKLDNEIGTVQVGKRANLLLLRGDPTRSIRTYDEIVKVILNGRVLDRSALAASSPVGPAHAAQSGPPSPATTFAIHDFTPDFWKFWKAAQGQPVERQAQLWQEQYVAAHQAVFDELAAPCKDQWNPDWSRAHYFTDLPRVVPAIRELVTGLGQQLDRANGRFLKMFPDMSWSGDIYIMASGYCFNGRAQTIQGRDAVLFGVDAMVALNQKDLIPTMQHELFHRYHHEFFDYEVQRDYPLWTALWAEGIATYVSERLNPSASEIDLAMVPLGMVRQVDDRRAEIAADFLRRFDSTAKQDATLFFNDANSKDPLIPGRAGYQLGVLVVTELSKQHSIQTMAHWSQAEAKPKIRAALERIAAK